MNKIYQKLSMAALSAAMVAAPAINVFAAPEDIIDTSKKATLTIHKYDITLQAKRKMVELLNISA